MGSVAPDPQIPVPLLLNAYAITMISGRPEIMKVIATLSESGIRAENRFTLFLIPL